MEKYMKSADDPYNEANLLPGLKNCEDVIDNIEASTETLPDSRFLTPRKEDQSLEPHIPSPIKFVADSTLKEIDVKFMPRINKVTERRLCNDDILLNISIDELPGRKSELSSPSLDSLYSTKTSTIKELIQDISSLESQEEILIRDLATRQTWKYVVHNELAKIQYKIFLQNLGLKDYRNAQLYRERCLESISEAEKLIHDKTESGNLNFKSIVYYNYSQFTYALNLQDKDEQIKA